MKAPTLISEMSDSVETNLYGYDSKPDSAGPVGTGNWTIKSAAVEGTGDSQYCYSMPGTALYVMQPNMESVENVKALMPGMVKDGEQFFQE